MARLDWRASQGARKSKHTATASWWAATCLLRVVRCGAMWCPSAFLRISIVHQFESVTERMHCFFRFQHVVFTCSSSFSHFLHHFLLFFLVFSFSFPLFRSPRVRCRKVCCAGVRCRNTVDLRSGLCSAASLAFRRLGERRKAKHSKTNEKQIITFRLIYWLYLHSYIADN